MLQPHPIQYKFHVRQNVYLAMFLQTSETGIKPSIKIFTILGINTITAAIDIPKLMMSPGL